MIANWLLPDLTKTIVLFEIQTSPGVFTPHGTGVLLLYKNVFFLATCKHIVLKPDGSPYPELHATINKIDGTASRKNIDQLHQDFKLNWFFHANPQVDLALSPIAIELGQEDIKTIGEQSLDSFEDTILGDDIFFLGYPLGLGVQNVPKLSPLVRQGIIALKNSDQTFLIDANVYGGSSGSPVFYKPNIATNNGKSIDIGKIRELKFLGIVNSNLNSREEAISKKTGRTRTIFEENAGLGTVQSASLLLEIFNSPGVQKIIPSTQDAQKQEEGKGDK